tara:strand:- start:59 stop:382 length:324 start_codon:yes stop_codon:yes gene_type:complete
MQQNEYEQRRHGSKPTKPQMKRLMNAFLMTIDKPLLPLATFMVNSLRLSQRVRNINTALGSCISSMMKKGRRYGDQVIGLTVNQSGYGSIYNSTWFGSNVLIINSNG